MNLSDYESDPAYPDVFREIAHGALAFFSAQNLSTQLEIIEKTPNELVTKLDVELEQRVRQIISTAFPSHSIQGEEMGTKTKKSDYTWFIDPIDGTNNFLRTRMEYATSVGLTFKGEPVGGVIIYPNENLYLYGDVKDYGVCAVKDGVAYAPRILSQHHVFVGLPSNGLRSLKFGPLLDRDDVAFRMSGAVGFDLGKMCLGQLDIRYGGNFKPEDVVAGIALLRASGGKALTSNGDRWTLSSQSLVAVRDKSFESLAINGGKQDG